MQRPKRQSQPGTVPRLLLETSEALAFINQEADAPAIERLIEMAENGHIELALARAAWEQLSDRGEERRATRLQRLIQAAKRQGNVFRIVHGKIGVDVVGSDQSPYVTVICLPQQTVRTGTR